MSNRVGQQLDKYRLIQLLGKGGFAEVYLGEHVFLKKLAAVKVLHTSLTEREDIEGFRKEAEMIAHLEHPHIIRILDFGIDQDTPYLVMDYATNGTLRERHPKGTPLPLPTIVSYVSAIADALQYAHDEKIIHRDIKPENFLLGRRNEVLLSDFGIAQVTQSSRPQSSQEVAGTAAYMAPEQIQGKPRSASDQYALGIVVYEWLSGTRPFHGSFNELCSQHLFVSPPPLQEKLPALSPEIEQVVMTALAKDPAQRFARIQAFAQAFEQACLGPHPMGESAPPFVPKSSEVSPESGKVIEPPIMPLANSSPERPQVILASTTPSEVNTPHPLPQPSLVTDPPDRSLSSLQQTPQPFQPTDLTSPPENPSLTPPPVPGPLSGETRPAKSDISRREFLVGLGGLTVLGVAGGVTWWIRSPHPLYTYMLSGLLLAVACKFWNCANRILTTR